MPAASHFSHSKVYSCGGGWGKWEGDEGEGETTLFIDIWSLAMKPILKDTVVPFCLLPLDSLIKHF